ncbi:uncharacterized protein LOC134776484 [Penaeus indicus]|uniref:uncharacterized protein LOC134776484 n=1 Tax=Penaeus indicus TaxID=29960 RepID=UPI00300CD12E
MEKRKVDVLCVQETRRKGEKARVIGGGCKMWYRGDDGQRNGVGVVVRGDLVDNVVEVERISDRMMTMKLEVNGILINIVCAYAPQVGCDEEKEAFWADMDETVEKIPRCERLVIGADLNAHVGEGNTNDEEVMGKHGFGRRNAEGQMVVDFAKRWELMVSNTMFVKRSKQKVTYSSGGRSTQVDYMLVRRERMRDVWDTKAIVGESVAKQHRMVVSRLVMWAKWRRAEKREPRTKWWKLRDQEMQNIFRDKVLESKVMEGNGGYKEVANTIRDVARETFGTGSGKSRREDQETWWWNEEVKVAVENKKEAKKQWDVNRDEGSKENYKVTKREAKRAVAIAKSEAFQYLYERLETKEGVNEAYRIAKQRNRQSQDVQQVKVVKSENGEVLVEGQANEREVEEVTEGEVKAELKKMKKGKARGPDDIPVEAWLSMGEVGSGWLTKLLNNLLKGEKMPDEWRKSVLIPIYKGKGDSKECGNYRGIKLMSHTMKLLERVVEASFALRQVMEKWREGQKELHCLFVDLEKAYDRVPRQELWECMRQARVSECYVEAIQDMYEGARTAVRSAAGLTEDFEVKVGLHQGSALSPFLFDNKIRLIFQNIYSQKVQNFKEFVEMVTYNAKIMRLGKGP